MERPGHTLLFRVYPLSECLPNYLDESDHYLPGLITGRSRTSAHCFHQRGRPPGYTDGAAELSEVRKGLPDPEEIQEQCENLPEDFC
jgi:hypothetical protein